MKDKSFWNKYVCSPSSNNKIKCMCRSESPSLYVLKKGSLTIEAALILPFFMMVLLAFFSFFMKYASAADLKLQVAAEAKKMGIAVGSVSTEQSGDITIYRTAKTESLWEMPFVLPGSVTEKAVCRAWIGFTGLETEETYVYITTKGNVYHLFKDCTHLDLSIKMVTFQEATTSKNQYGQKYRACELCDEPHGLLAYITEEGNCYHSKRTCSGLKRTVRRVILSEVQGRSCCIRCVSREE